VEYPRGECYGRDRDVRGEVVCGEQGRRAERGGLGEARGRENAVGGGAGSEDGRLGADGWAGSCDVLVQDAEKRGLEVALRG